MKDIATVFLTQQEFKDMVRCWRSVKQSPTFLENKEWTLTDFNCEHTVNRKLPIDLIDKITDSDNEYYNPYGWNWQPEDMPIIPEDEEIQVDFYGDFQIPGLVDTYVVVTEVLPLRDSDYDIAECDACKCGYTRCECYVDKDLDIWIPGMTPGERWAKNGIPMLQSEVDAITEIDLKDWWEVGRGEQIRTYRCWVGSNLNDLPS